MKKLLWILILAVSVLASCGPKPYYETSMGKKKLRHYNRIQFGQQDRPAAYR
jgi:hypothetical protein